MMVYSAYTNKNSQALNLDWIRKREMNIYDTTNNHIDNLITNLMKPCLVAFFQWQWKQKPEIQ